MANKVTGSTDTTGALSVSSSAPKSALIVGKSSVEDSVANVPFIISGTSDVKEKFGTDSKLVAAAKILIAGGADYITGVIVDSDAESEADGYSAALDSTFDDASVKCILLDKFAADIITVLKTHLTTAEANDKFRYAVVAPASTVTSQTDLIAFAKSVASDRIFAPGPGNTDSTNTAIDPVSMAAGIVAVIMTETDDPALPANGVVVNGIGTVARPVLDTEKKILAAGGIVVLYNQDGMPVVYRLVTSSQDEIWKEGTTRFIADYVLESNENLLRANYKRTKNVTRILESIKTDIKTNMERMEGLEIIENFDPTTLTVVKDPSDIYGALVDYEFDVVTPLYTITITQHMKL